MTNKTWKLVCSVVTVALAIVIMPTAIVWGGRHPKMSIDKSKVDICGYIVRSFSLEGYFHGNSPMYRQEIEKAIDGRLDTYAVIDAGCTYGVMSKIGAYVEIDLKSKRELKDIRLEFTSYWNSASYNIYVSESSQLTKWGREETEKTVKFVPVRANSWWQDEYDSSSAGAEGRFIYIEFLRPVVIGGNIELAEIQVYGK